MRWRIPFIFLVAIVSFASCSLSKQINKADKQFEIGEYYAASERYKMAYKRIPKEDKNLRAYVAFKQAECYYLINDSRAIATYKTAITNKYFTTDSIIFLHYAYVLQYQGKYAEAKQQYETYLKNRPDDTLAKVGLASCEDIEEMKKEGGLSRQNIAFEKDFNQKKSSSLSPVFIGKNADMLLFTSNRQEQKGANKTIKNFSKITGKPIFHLYSIRVLSSGEWGDIEQIRLFEEGAAQNEKEKQNDKKNNPIEYGVGSFTEDGKTLFFSFSQHINGEDQGTKIYTTNRLSGEWSEPQEVVLFADSSISVAHPAINATGDLLYFTSDKPDGYGGKDIYVAEKTGKSWGNIRNLGPTINTAGDEMFPTVRSNGVLYFSSNGHAGFGGLDLFVATPDSLNSKLWKIRNMGVPFNSSFDDFGITFMGKKENGFFSSSRPYGKYPKGYDHIYSFIQPEPELIIDGYVVNTRDEVVDGATIRMVGNDGTNIKMQAKRDGSYKIKLNKNVRYIMLASARGHLNTNHEFTTDEKENQHYNQNFVLSPIYSPSSIDNIFFEFGKWEVSKSSEPGLKSLLKLMQDNPHITIELAAHTDIIGDSLLNIELSQKRANSVVNYLIHNGIDPDRLTPIGYGTSKPIVADAQLHEKHSFMPINQVLDKAYILTLPKEEQEICNQINRRIEFRVLKTTYKLY